jgi:hypothetical protein
MHPTLNQDIASTITAERHREARAARAAAGARTPFLRLRRRRRAIAAPVLPAAELKPAPRA